MKARFHLISLLTVFVLGINIIYAQIPTRPNLYDKDSLRTGQWLFLYDTLDNKVSTPDSAKVYCTISFHKGVPNRSMECFYFDGIRQWSGRMKSIDPDIKHGPAEFFYPLGNIQYKAYYYDNKLEGEFKGYNENGQLQNKGMMKNDENIGLWEYFHPNGRMMSLGEFVDGKANGFWEFYHDNGQFQSKGYIDHGSYEGEWKVFYSNGKTEYIMYYKNNMAEGPYTGYYENGILEQTGHFKENKQHGDFVFYYDNGNVKSQGKIVEGLYQGPWKFYHENGNLESKRIYVDDKEEGHSKYYYESGVLKSQGNVTHDQWNGDITFYYENGNIESTGRIENGLYQGIWLSNYEDGKIKIKRGYKNDVEHGIWNYHTPEGMLIEIGSLNMGEKEGFWEFKFPDGKINYKGEFLKDKKNGAFEYYYENGNPKRKAVYTLDTLDGPYEYYFENGILKSKGLYVKDKREGEWLFNHNNGQLSTKGLYANGTSEGEWKYYYPSGILKKEGEEHLDKSYGYWKYYYENGVLEQEGDFTSNLRQGRWKYYYENGQLRYTGKAKNDIAYGKWEYFDSLGRKTSEGAWKGNDKDSIWVYYDSIGQITSRGNVIKNRSDGVWWYYKNGKKDYKELFDRGTLIEFWNLRDSCVNVSNRFQTDSAFRIAKVAKKYWKKQFGKDDKNYNTYWRMMGDVYEDAGDYDKALKAYQRSSDEVKRVEGEDSWNYAISLGDLGYLYYEMNLFDKSLDYFKRSLVALGNTEDGKTTDSYFNSLVELVNNYYRNDQTEVGIELLINDIKYRQDSLPDQVDNIASAYHRIAEMYYRVSEYDSALLKYQQLYDYLDQKEISNHFTLREAYRFTAYIYSAQSNSDSTIRYFKKSIAQYKRDNALQNIGFVYDYIGLSNEFYGSGDYSRSNSYADSAVYFSEVQNLIHYDSYIEALLAKGKSQIGLYDYENSLNIYQKAIEINENKKVVNRRYLSNSYQGIGIALEELYPNEPEKAEEYYLKSINLYGNIQEYNSNYVNTSLLLASFYRKKRYYEKCKNLLFDLRDYYEAFEDPGHYYHAKIYQYLGRLYSSRYIYDSAEMFYRKALDYYGIDKKNNINNYSGTINNIAITYERREQYDKALKLKLEALNLLEEYLGKDHQDYFDQLGELALFHRKKGNYNNAIVLYKQVLEFTGKYYGYNSEPYIDVLGDIGYAYNLNDQHLEAENIGRQMLTGLTNNFEGLNYYFLEYYEVMCDAKKGQRNFDEAEPFYEDMIDYSEKYYGSNHESHAYYLKEAALFYNYFGRNKEALQCLLPAVEIVKRTQGEQSQKYAWYIESLGDIQYAAENYTEALKAREQIVEIYRNVYGENSESFIDAKSDLAKLYDALGRYSDSEIEFKEALLLTKNTYSKYTLKYAGIMEDYARMYRWWKKPTKALEILDEAISILDSLNNTHETWYFDIYNMQGLALTDLGRINEARDVLLKAQEGAIRNWGKKNNYFTYTNNLAFTYIETEDYAEAERLFLEAGKRFDTYVTITDLDLVNFEDNLAALYLAWGKMDKAEKYWTNVTDVLLKKINSSMAYMSDSEKANFWDAYKQNFENFNSYAIKASSNNKKALGQMFNNQLQTKSILLSSSTKERTRIMNSGDSLLISKYYEYLAIKEDLSKYYGYTNEQLAAENIKIDSIEHIADQFEKVLSLDATALAAEERAKNVRWKDIQRKLKDHEAAVEMIRFRYFHKHLTDSVLYGALILTNETHRHPELFILPNGQELEQKYIKNYLTSIKYKVADEYSYEQYWQLIDQKLKGKSVVYFSPDGVFNQININTLQRPNGSFVLDDYNVHILTSTRDVLILDKETKRNLDNQVASLFGFPQYDLEHSAIENIVEERSLQRSRNLERAMDLERFGFSDLPGTKTETQSIAEILSDKKWQAELYLGDEALEEILKSVSSPSVLHIATHGFFLSDVEDSNTVQLGVRADRGKENPLLRSGLLLAGAAQTVYGKYDNRTENGIFTAYEAMNLDLSNTDLVVLSACETGKGEVKSGEGVYGLQRAFQIAGAESIIMSLWKVNDEATQMLMTNFYQNWLSGMQKDSAFRNAQLTVRSKFKDPYYWGAFVLIGG